MYSTADILKFWGKAMSSANATVPYHPAAYHLLDVAAVADALLVARPLARERAARLLGLPVSEAHGLIVALAALHDLGKFTPTFQAKELSCWPPVLGPYDPAQVASTRHTDDGYVLWQADLASQIGPRLWYAGGDALEALAQAVFGHHGRPLVTSILRGRPVEGVFRTAGREMALACANLIVDLLHPEPVASPPPTIERAKIASWWIAGLVTIADWIGSRELWFPYRAPDSSDADLAAYWARARDQARRAVREEGLDPPRAAASQTFTQLTGIDTPSPAQSWASSVELPQGPVLMIIEDVTGAGKTEAAQMLVHRLMVDGRAAGAYWAMPTQATANAMYLRQANVIDALFDNDGRRPSLALAHGQARLHDGFRATVLASGESHVLPKAIPPLDDPELPSGVACAAFFADDRRAALLADVGAGTVDQALLGVLPTKFNSVRLFGLADRVLVLDEVHAYDAYMGVEVRELLRFHAALGGNAVVLSATLSLAQREELARAWSEGVDGRRRSTSLFGPPPAALVHDTSYPLATVVSSGSMEGRETPLDSAEWSCRKAGVRFVHELSAALDHVVAAAEAGAAVAWVRNTVNDCLAAEAALRERGLTPLVFHARFAQADRQEREREVLQLFGKRSSTNERAGRVLVATQVIEQSLDIDFDSMVSDLAPVDLLIQRAGRLWRHPERNAERPAGLERELVVLAPPMDSEPTKEWINDLLPGTGAVYDNTGVLWRTARVLGDAACIDTPGGVRMLIESVYASDDVPETLALAAERAEGKDRGDASAATYQVLDLSDGYDGSARGWVNELRAATRLSDPQTTIRLARVTVGGWLEPWARSDGPAWKVWALSEVRVSARQVRPGALAEATYRVAVDTVRSQWGRFECELPVLPLVEAEPGIWRGVLEYPDRGRPVSARYTVAQGFEIEKASSDCRG